MSDTAEVEVEPPPLTLTDRFSRLLSLVDDQSKAHASFMKNVNLELKFIQKELSKTQSKSGKKKKEKVEGEDVVKRKNVFEVPVPVSDELCEFLGLDKGVVYSRQFITNSMFSYVKGNDLQNPANRRYILVDTTDAGRKLGTLLKPDQPLTFFNMQRYLNPHYPKVDKSSMPVDPTPPPVVTRDTGVVPDAAVVLDGAEYVEPEVKKKARRVARKSSA